MEHELNATRKLELSDLGVAGPRVTPTDFAFTFVTTELGIVSVSVSTLQVIQVDIAIGSCVMCVALPRVMLAESPPYRISSMAELVCELTYCDMLSGRTECCVCTTD